ncbi:hypothetical protein GP486_000636 [Trichoglossum hirsutum]|uniref:F-box domain-containing protein n=1 Tax=Trichoglossum hirsutum TaxID=265104 RepID=A0A9P8RTV2_9PEZI|nr:hypothetical protein GP486_000636 [Trichoglossum hirsutum]
MRSSRSRTSKKTIMSASKTPRACGNDHSKAFPFLSLPTEIRVEIYRLLLVRPRSFNLCDRYYLPKHPPPTVSLLLVNRQIYSESVQIMYGENTFDFTLSGTSWESPLHDPKTKKLTRNHFYVRNFVFEIKPLSDVFIRSVSAYRKSVQSFLNELDGLNGAKNVTIFLYLGYLYGKPHCMLLRDSVLEPFTRVREVQSANVWLSDDSVAYGQYLKKLMESPPEVPTLPFDKSEYPIENP